MYTVPRTIWQTKDSQLWEEPSYLQKPDNIALRHSYLRCYAKYAITCETNFITQSISMFTHNRLNYVYTCCKLYATGQGWVNNQILTLLYTASQGYDNLEKLEIGKESW